MDTKLILQSAIAFVSVVKTKPASFFQPFFFSNYLFISLICSLLYVTISIGSSTVSIAQTIIDTIEVDPAVAGVGVNSLTNRIYVANQGGNNVSVIDGATNQVINTIDMGGVPSRVGVNPVTNRIYVSMFDDTLIVINGATDEISDTIILGNGTAGAVDVNSGTDQIYVANGLLTGSVTVIDGLSNNIIKTIQLPSFPGDVGVNSTTNRVYVSFLNYVSFTSSIGVIDGSVNDIIDTIDIGGFTSGAVGINPATNLIYVTIPTQNQVVVIDGSSNTTIDTINVGEDPVSVGFNPTTNHIYVANSVGHDVSVIDGNTNSAINTILIEGFPFDIGINPDTNRIYVTDGDTNVTVIRDEGGAPSPATPTQTATPTPTATPLPLPQILGVTIISEQKISDTEGNFNGMLNFGDFFGSSVTSIGDLDEDGVTDIAVGAAGEDEGSSQAKGAVWIMLLNADGTVKSHQKISNTQGNFNGVLDDNVKFGSSVTSLGDLYGDGVTDIVVGAELDSDGGISRGAV